MYMSLEEVLRPNKYLLSVVGIWPLNPSKSNNFSRLFAYLRILVHAVCVCLLIFPILCTICVTWGNVSILADYGSIMFLYLLTLMKLIYVILRRRACRRVHREIEQLWEISYEAQERHCLEKFAMLAKNVTIACVIATYSDILMFVVPPAIADFVYRLTVNRTDIQRILPLDISCGFGYQQSPIFELLFILQTLGFLCSITSVVGNDCTVMAVILHVAGQFRLISTRLQAIGNVIYYKKIREKLLIMEIGRCIAHHQRIIRISKDLSDLIGPMFFGQILTSGLVVCLGGFALIKGNSGEAEIVKFSITFVCIIMQLVVWCWPGELLIQESAAIAETVFSEMPWFMLPARVQRDLSFMVLRAQKESSIVSFWQVMSIPKLTEVFNTAGSYMALLRSMQDSN